MCQNRGMARGASFLMKQLQKNTKIAGDLSPLIGRFLDVMHQSGRHWLY